MHVIHSAVGGGRVADVNNHFWKPLCTKILILPCLSSALSRVHFCALVIVAALFGVLCGCQGFARVYGVKTHVSNEEWYRDIFYVKCPYKSDFGHSVL
jgi:hypothetical protein